MSGVRNHIIHRQTIEVEIPGARSVSAVQERIRDTWYDSILPGLDTIFSSLVDSGTIIRIDKIQVDLGRLSETMLEKQLSAKTLESIRKVLEEQLRFDPGASDGVSALPVSKSDVEILLYFLANGRLPWWSPVKDLEVLERAIMERGKLPDGYSARFLATIGDTLIMRRLRAQFSRPFLRFLAVASIPQFFERAGADDGAGAAGADADPADVLAAYSRGEKLPLPGADPASGGSPTNAGSSFSDEGPQTATQPNDDPPPQEPDTTAAPAASAAPETTTGNTPPAMTGALLPTARWDDQPAPGDPQPALIDPDKERSISSGAEVKEEIRSDASPASSQPGRAHPDDGAIPGPDPSITDLSIKKKEEGDRMIPPHRQSVRDIDDEAIYMEFAGLVILHPFIMPFFDALGLAEGRSFRDDTCLHKAVHLLGYLATGEADLQEQRLILPKLLCGMPLTDPVERSGIITDAEQAEAENLLTTVISHWKAMKNASTAAIREMFLQREGRLSTLENGWLLNVQKKTVDILMGSIPWGISVVKYPWMRTLLFVSWG